jgi:chromosome segregation ATPase
MMEREAGLMSARPPDLGKGLFGYRKSAVHQIIGDRDAMLRHAEVRMRRAEAKVGALEAEVESLKEVDLRKDEHIARLKAQVDESTNQTAEVDRGWQELEAEAEKLAAWRGRVAAMSRSVAAKLADLHATMDQLPDRVEGAFAPLTERVSSLHQRAETVAVALKSLPLPRG